MKLEFTVTARFCAEMTVAPAEAEDAVIKQIAEIGGYEIKVGNERLIGRDKDK